MKQEVVVRAQGVLFDMDGVLISSIGSVQRCWRRWAEHYALPDAEHFEIQHGVRAVDIIRRVKPDIDVAEGLRLIEDMEIEDTADLQVLAGVRTLLAGLPPERWAIVTSATYRLLLGRLQAAELPLPKNIVSADRVEKGKPDPEPYRRGAELVGSAAGDCVVIEDAPSGVRSGRSAGCRVLAVLGTHQADELQEAGAEWVVETLEDVQSVKMTDGLELRFQVILRT